MPKDKQQKYSLKQVGLLSDLPDISRESRFHVKVVTNIKITNDTFMLSLERPAEFNFIPGQYIWLVLPEFTKYLGTIDRRAYSISSNKDSSIIELLINTTESDYLKKVIALKPNEEVDIIGPMGSSFVVPSSGAILIAGGTGISPFMSILRSHVAKDLCLIAYSRKEKDSLHFENELKDLSNKYGYKITLKKTGPRSSDFSHVTRKECTDPIFITGSQGFVDFVTDILIKNGVLSKRMHYEENYPQTEESKKLKDMFTNFFYGDWTNSTQKLSGISDLFLEVVKQSSNYVVLTDHDGKILFANQASMETTGYTFAEMQGQTPRLWGGLMPDFSYQNIWSSLKKGEGIKKVLINRRRDGSLYSAIATLTPISRQGIYMATEENITTLREVDKTKTEFVSIASHQLRTPLSAVNWYTEMLLDGDVGKLTDKQIEYLKEIYSGNQRMIELVDSLLDVSRLDLGTFVISPKPVNLIESAQNMINEQQNKIKEKNINFSFKYKKDIPIIEADPKLIDMITQNLLSNAVKYTPEGGKIKITLSLYKKYDILMKVIDNGYGIPSSQKNRLFTKFFRADNVRLKSTEGTGLGLYIVKSVVEGSGGKIWFESEENKGTTFFVTIPIKAIVNKEKRGQ